MMAFARQVPRIFLALLVTVLSGAGATATPFTPAQVLDYTRIGDMHFSQDGSKLAFVVGNYTQDMRPRVEILDVASGTLTEITPDKKADRSPQWSPDGKTLAFLSNRGEHTQIWLMPAAGGDAVALTASKKGISGYRWSPDGKSIAFLAQDDSVPDDDNAPQVADDGHDRTWLWVIDVASRKITRLKTAGYDIDEFQWRDPSHLLLLANNKPGVEEYTDEVYGLAVPNGAVTPVAQPPQPFEGLIVSPDGKTFAVRSTQTHGPDARDIFVGTGHDLHDATAALDRAVTQIQWHDPSTIWFAAAEGFETRLYKMTVGAAPQPVALPMSPDIFDVSRDGSIAFAAMDFAHFEEVYLRKPDGSIRQLTHMQPTAVAAHLAPTTIFHTKSFDGTDIESALVKPADARGKLPLVLLVHGGPSSRFKSGYYWETAWAQLLASHGYEVLMVNPRGSTGYSEDFVKANRADWGGGDYKDLMAALDAVIARGDTDPNRLGIGGWSYGGEMTMWAITQSNRFKAAVAGAGVYDQQAEFETEDDPQGDEWYFGTPWEHPEIFARNSPATYIAHAHTPTLIFDGADDEANPVGQSKGLYRALKHLGVETKLVLYPNEGHSPRRMRNNVDMFQRLLDWYDGHLK